MSEGTEAYRSQETFFEKEFLGKIDRRNIDGEAYVPLVPLIVHLVRSKIQEN